MMKILIIRLSAIGDIVMASGILAPLKEKFKSSTIDWLVQSEYKDLLTATKTIDRVLKWDRKEWVRLFKAKKFIKLSKEIFFFLKELRERRYDLIIDLQGLLKSICWLVVSYGQDKLILDPKELKFFWKKKSLYSPKSKEIGAEYKFLLKKLNVPYKDFKLNLEVSDEDKRSVEDLLKEFDLKIKRYFVFAPFTTRPQKKWPVEYWIELSRKIGHSAVILGSIKDKEEAKKLEKGSKYLIDLTGRTNLREAICLIQNSCGLIGIDTGFTHVAMLSKIPTVAIFGSTCPYTITDNPYGIVLYEKMPCSPCKRDPVCNGKFTCMNLIIPEKVIEILKNYG